MKKEELFRIFSHMPTLETEHLLLRPMRVCDADDMYDYAKRPDVTRYLLWRPHQSRDYTKRYLEYLAGRYRLGLHYEWALICKADRRMIGTCGFASVDCPHNSAEIGYVLHPDYHGKGLMLEAARRVIAFGFEEMKLHRIEARYMVGNDPSRLLMERLGMRPEGVRRGAMLVKGAYRDIGTYAILESDPVLE